MEIALYRKYRPQSFKEVKGQDHIVSVLENEVKTGKINHAYLFSGSRGTGKTTLARIFANSLGINTEDIYEIDGASNRGIDEIREIRDAVHTYPYSSKYKVYIVDEVHMLTKEAWNAFLKTLEEPPEHVIFIMATTEQHKLPDTVISRCECFAFKKPTHGTLVEAILKIVKAEKYEIEKKSASLIATLADGSFRDAFGILQKAMHSSNDKKLSLVEIENVLGAPKESFVLEVLESIAEQNTEKGIMAVRKASEENADMQVFLKMILRSLRFVLLLRFAKDLKNLVVDETGEEEFGKLLELSKTAKNINSKTLLAFLEGYSRQTYASIPELPIELAIIDSITENKI
ncbi:MAG: DNA polymerase III, subunit gamma and tau [Candidatus Zambryskibacteria bacterium RIFCSPLOWO2_02_FULL_38_13]|nr:MAG: DNA polymerase III, subunit gamma and tau [Candidatus Zambryskibacteria bacterium RIFCSPLOWO2_02_FULL_38_13]